MSTATHLFDLGGNTERPVNPPEPNVTERELDALRQRLRAEIEEDLDTQLWVRQQVINSIPIGTRLIVSLLLYRDGCADEAEAEIEKIRELELARREREELANE